MMFLEGRSVLLQEVVTAHVDGKRYVYLDGYGGRYIFGWQWRLLRAWKVWRRRKGVWRA